MNWHQIIGDVLITLLQGLGIYLCYSFGKFWTKENSEKPFVSIGSAVGIALFVGATIVGKLSVEFIELVIIAAVSLSVGMIVGVTKKQQKIN